MQEVHKHDTDIDYCPSCKGVWLDRGEIDKIASMQNRFEEDHFQRYHRDDRGYSDDDDDYYSRGRRRGGRGFFGDLFDFD